MVNDRAPSTPALPDVALSLPILVGGWSLPFAMRWFLIVAGCVLPLLVGVRYLRGDAIAEGELVFLTPPVLVTGLLLLGMRRSRWLEIAQEGFYIQDSTGERIYIRDDQVSVITCEQRPSFDFGDDAPVHDIQLEVERPTGRLPLSWRYRNRPEAPLALENFLRRLIDGLAHRTFRLLSQGGRLEGHGWYADAQGLHLRQGRFAWERLSIVSLGVCFGQLRIFRDDEAHPFVVLPSRQPNVHVLGRLLHLLTSPRPIVSHPLGRHIFTLTSLDWVHIPYAIISLAMSLFMVCGALTNGWEAWGFSVAAAIFAIVALATGCLGWNAYLSRVEIYEHGATQPRRGKSVRFDQLVRLQANRHLSRLILHSASESSAQTISFWGTRPRIHPDNDRLLELLAQPLALNWLNHLREGRPVDWTPELRLHPRELELIHRDWWGNYLSERETYEGVLLYKTKHFVTFSHSHAMMLPPGEWFPRVFSVQVLFRAPNFLVGWLLLTWIRQMPELLTRSELAPGSLHVHPRSDS